jgi:hypothetical protein
MGVEIQTENITVYPPDYDPMAVAIARLTTATAILERIALTLENRAAEKDIIYSITAGTLAGSVRNLAHPRIRGKFLVFVPLGTGEPVLRYGDVDLLHTSIVAVPFAQIYPFPFVWQEGIDIVLYDALAPTDTPDFSAMIVGTTE